MEKRKYYALIIFLLFLYGCASAPPTRISDEIVLSGMGGTSDSPDVRENALPSAGGTPLAQPPRGDGKKKSLEGTVLTLLQLGSPESIHRAVERINEDSQGMTDQNRIALAIAGEMVRILYPFESVTWPMPSVPDTDPYINIIKTARMGAYDYTADSADFFSLVLPSFVLLTSPSEQAFYKDAEKSLLRAAELNRKSVLPHWFLGLIAERKNDLRSADRYYQKAWELDDSCYPAGIAYTRSLVRRGQGELALENAQMLSARYPNAIELVRLCADAAFSMQNWDVADAYILEVLKADPRNTDYLLLRARILVERRDYLKANSLLDAFATTNRTNKNYLMLRARVAREWNRNPAAATAFLQEAVRLYPEDQEVLLSTASISYQTGVSINNRSARDFVSMVLARDSENRNALTLLLSDYIGSGEWSNAVNTGERLVSLNPSASSRELLVQAYLGAGEPKKAVSIARSLYESSSRTDSLTGLYIQALIDIADTAAARTIIAERKPNASSSLKSVLFFHESRMITNPEQRLSVLRSSLLADPRNGNALFAMYQWYFDRDDYRKAQYYLKQVIALEPMNHRYVELLENLDVLLAR
ncbi:MAG TPA: tetratricopeptide repeat protein [Treponema sp.]|nr:tetratricopeptide repeat protein [Treponema sp.]